MDVGKLEIQNPGIMPDGMRVTFYPHSDKVKQPDAKISSRHQVGTKSAPSRHQVAEKELDFAIATQKLSVFCEEARTLNEMMNFLGWKDRTKFRKKFIYPLIEKEILARTIPDKPQSSNQRYIVTNRGAK